jgi:hypothetical protein
VFAVSDSQTFERLQTGWTARVRKEIDVTPRRGPPARTGYNFWDP